MKSSNGGKRYISLGYKILLFALIISTVPMLVVDMILYRQASEMVIASEHAAMINSLSHIGTNVETVLSHVDELSVMLIQDVSVRAWLSTPKENATLLARNQLAVEKQLTFSVWNKKLYLLHPDRRTQRRARFHRDHAPARCRRQRAPSAGPAKGPHGLGV